MKKQHRKRKRGPDGRFLAAARAKTTTRRRRRKAAVPNPSPASPTIRRRRRHVRRNPDLGFLGRAVVGAGAYTAARLATNLTLHVLERASKDPSKSLAGPTAGIATAAALAVGADLAAHHISALRPVADTVSGAVFGHLASVIYDVVAAKLIEANVEEQGSTAQVPTAAKLLGPATVTMPTQVPRLTAGAGQVYPGVAYGGRPAVVALG